MHWEMSGEQIGPTCSYCFRTQGVPAVCIKGRTKNDSLCLKVFQDDNVLYTVEPIASFVFGQRALSIHPGETEGLPMGQVLVTTPCIEPPFSCSITFNGRLYQSSYVYQTADLPFFALSVDSVTVGTLQGYVSPFRQSELFSHYIMFHPQQEDFIPLCIGAVLFDLFHRRNIPDL